MILLGTLQELHRLLAVLRKGISHGLCGFLGVGLDLVLADVLVISCPILLDSVRSVGTFHDDLGWLELVLGVSDEDYLVGLEIFVWDAHGSNF